jgi:hypothetical protein
MDHRVKPGGDEMGRSYFVIAGLDPAIHADVQHAKLLGLHSHKPPAGDALRRRHPRPHSPCLRTSRRSGEGFTNTYGVKMLVYYEQHATAIAAIQREKNIKHWSRKMED